jgi:Protein of unknown function (DUF3617)
MPASQFMLSKQSYLAKATCGVLFMALVCASHASVPSEATNIVMAASKQLKLLPGLWEVAMRISGTVGGTDASQMWPQLMDKMQPEQRKMMQTKLAEQHITAEVNTFKMLFCATPEMAEIQAPASFSNHCTQKIDPLVNGTLQFSSVCTNPDISAEGRITIQGITGYLVNVHVSQIFQGKPETMTVNADSQYLSADCGTVKPMVLKPKQ